MKRLKSRVNCDRSKIETYVQPCDSKALSIKSHFLKLEFYDVIIFM